jgi:hypothetical protein
MRKFLLCLLLTGFVLSPVLFAQELTVKMLDKEMFPQEKIVTCESCKAKNSSFNKFCVNCGEPLNKEDVSAFFLVKAGTFIPGDSAMRDAYGTPLGVGFALNLEHKGFGLMFEVDNYLLERLTPITTSATTVTAPAEKDWMNAALSMLYTPVTLSVYVTENFYSMKAYAGVGAGICMIRQETRGSYFLSSQWNYADVIGTENLACYQVFVGVVKNNKIGMELKDTFIPSLGKYPYPYVGGLSTSVSLLF